MKLSLYDLDLKDKKVLLRVDYNVPLKQDATIADDTRIKESLPSIEYILKNGGAVILMSHLGRPDGKADAKFSLAPCAQRLSQLLHRSVIMAKNCIGAEVEQVCKHLKPGQIILLENLRFHPAEENPSLDPSFAKQLAALGNVYVDDAFAAAHRNHSSIVAITHFFPHTSAAGFLVLKEMQCFEQLLSSPKKPFHALIGGSKISTKMGVLKALVPKISDIFIGGGMAFTFFKAQGLSIGNSIHEDEQVLHALNFLEECRRKHVNVWLPKDCVIADAFNEKAASKTIDMSHGGIPEGWQGMDIGPATIIEWKEHLKKATTVFWNGPLGVFEFEKFANGTKEIATFLAGLSATTIVGGGDSVAAINQLHLGEQFTHLSTGGGASLEWIEQGHLPGIDALSEKMNVI